VLTIAEFATRRALTIRIVAQTMLAIQMGTTQTQAVIEMATDWD
jgi:hypothetical protein